MLTLIVGFDEAVSNGRVAFVEKLQKALLGSLQKCLQNPKLNITSDNRSSGGSNNRQLNSNSVLVPTLAIISFHC